MTTWWQDIQRVQNLERRVRELELEKTEFFGGGFLMYEYQATVLRVVDGDTIHARVDLGLDVRIDLVLRLYGINAPEMPTEQGVTAKEWLLDALPKAEGALTIKTLKDRREKYGRYLAILYSYPLIGESFNQRMIDAGLAVPYPATVALPIV